MVLGVVENNATRLRVASWDADAGTWETFPTSANEGAMTACASVSHFSDFTVLSAPASRSFVSIWWPLLTVVPVVMVGLGGYWLWFAQPKEESDDEDDGW